MLLYSIAGAVVAPVLFEFLGPGLNLTALSSVDHLGLLNVMFFCIASSCPSPVLTVAGFSNTPSLRTAERVDPPHARSDGR